MEQMKMKKMKVREMVEVACIQPCIDHLNCGFVCLIMVELMVYFVETGLAGASSGVRWRWKGCQW